MASFPNTSATHYFPEALIKDARDRLVLISPFLRLNDASCALGMATLLLDMQPGDEAIMPSYTFVSKEPPAHRWRFPAASHTIPPYIIQRGYT